MAPRDHVYVRLDPDTPAAGQSRAQVEKATIRQHVTAARANGFTVHSRLAVTERVGASVAASGRPKLMALIRQLKPRDALVVYTLDGLGRDAADILKTVRMISDRHAEPFCAALERVENLSNDPDFTRIMEAVAALDHLRERERKQANGRGVKGGQIGRRPSLEATTQAAVRADLAAGDPIATLARRYNTSRQTIMRVRDAKPKS